MGGTLARALAASLVGAALALLAPAVARASNLQATVQESSALPLLVKGGGGAMRAQWAFWGADWSWAGQEITTSEVRGLERRVSGRNEMLATTLDGRIEQPDAGTLRWTWRFATARTVKPAVGGGIEFSFDLAAYRDALGEPRLLPDRRGWAWGRPGGEQVEMRFEPAAAAVYFEQGRRDTIRVFFWQEEVPAGVRPFTATLAVSGGTTLRPSDSQRFGLTGAGGWPLARADTVDPGIDLSFLNADDRPAGRRGFVRAQGDRLVFGDGTPARFWGTNLAAYALFGTPRDQVPLQARRLARLGFNLVRIHHHDSPWVSPNIFGDLAKVKDSQRIDPASRDALDWWIKCLIDEGIHVWLDIHVQRHFRAGDGIEAFDELPAAYELGHRDPKGFAYVNRSIQAAMDRFAEGYLTAVNPYTRRRLVDEPGVVAVQVTNEHDVTHHFGNALLPDKGVPKHSALFMAAAERFAETHGLSSRRTWRAWEHGPAKRFLNDLEHGFHRDRIRRLRELGLRVPVSTTSQWGDNPLVSLPALTAGELIDAHAYADVDELGRDPRFKPTLAHFAATAQLLGRPFSLSEWNVGTHHAPDRHALPLYVAATAAHQGWDALMQYAYAQSALRHDGSTDGWSLFNDPALVVPMAAAAVLYRHGHVREAGRTYVFAPDAGELFDQGLSADNAAGLRVAAERGRLVIAMPRTPELPWLRADTVPDGTVRVRDARRTALAAGVTSIRSDHGELERDWARSTFTVDTPSSQGAAGFIGGRGITLGDVRIRVEAPHAAVSVHALDRRPIAESRHLLVAVSAVNQPVDDGRASQRSQPLGGELRIRAPAGLQLQAIVDGRVGKASRPARDADGHYVLPLGSEAGSRWLILRGDGPAR